MGRGLLPAVLVALSLSGPGSAENVNLDGIPMNGAESSVTTTIINSNPPIKIGNVITNNTGAAFSFDWPGAGPGGFCSILEPTVGGGTSWEWETFATLYTIVTPIVFTPALDVPVFGSPMGGVQGVDADLAFEVPGKSIFVSDVTPLSAGLLESSLIQFFSPAQTIATCSSSFSPGKFEQILTNDSDETIMVSIEQLNCCNQPDQTLCDGDCESFLTDPDNCGGCGIECAGQSACVFGCCSGTDNCNGICSDLESDPLNCGACGNNCPEDRFCGGGECLCDAGIECGGACTDSQTDPQNCGACFNFCDFSECPTGTGTCSGGDCLCDPFEESDCCDPEGESCSDEDCQDIVCEYTKGACCEGWSPFCAEEAMYFEVCGCDGGPQQGDPPATLPSSEAGPGGFPSKLSASVRAPASRTTGRSGTPDRRGAGHSISSGRTPVSNGRPSWFAGRTSRSDRPTTGIGSFPQGRRHLTSLTGNWPVTAVPLGSTPTTSPLEQLARGGTHPPRGDSTAGESETACSLIDFEGIPNAVAVGTIEGTPSTTFGPSWTALIDSDAGGSGNFANEPSSDTAVTFLSDIQTQNSTSPAGNAAAFEAWLDDIGITAGEIEHTVDFEEFDLDEEESQNISGVEGLFTDLIIRDTAGGEAFVRGFGFGGSNPVGEYSLAHDEEPFLELDFSSRPVDYVAFKDIDHTGVTGTVELVGGEIVPISFETTAFGGDSAEFFGIFHNDKPRIVRVQLDASGDGQWGIDDIHYGRTTVPVSADPIDFDSAVQFVEVFYTASATSLPAVLKAWDGPGGTGSIVDAVLGNTVGTDFDGAPCIGDPTGNFCLWNVMQLTSATNDILSITLEGATENQLGFDNMTFCTGVPDTGACCTGATCLITTEANCASLGGSYQDNEAPCAPNTCGDPFVVGVDEAGLCDVQPSQTDVPPGQEVVVSCEDSAIAGREVSTQVTVFGADGTTTAQGPCQVIVPFDDFVVGEFEPSPFSVLVFDDSRDYLLQPGESAEVLIEVLNLGTNELHGIGANPVQAQLISPPGFFNPLPVTFSPGQSTYADFEALTEAASCVGAGNFNPVTNDPAFGITLHPNQGVDVARGFKVVFTGVIPGTGVVTKEMSLALGIGRPCGPAGGLPYDGIAGFSGLVAAELAPLDYPVNFSDGSFTVGNDIALDFQLFCGPGVSDPLTFTLLPQIVSIEHELDGEILGDIIPDPNDRFFTCGSSCTFDLGTSQIAAGKIIIEVAMPDSKRYQAGLTLSE